jgi:hypothetical protein
MKKIVLFLGVWLATTTLFAQETTTWWLNGATEKIVASTVPRTQALTIATGRLEYAPFQLAIVADATERTFDAPSISYPQDLFTVTWYTQFFIPILQKPPVSEVFTLARITTESAIPDGLIPLESTFVVPANQPGVLWADVYVNSGTPAGDYAFDITFANQTQTVVITVYDVDIPPTSGISVLIPTKRDDNVEFYAEMGADGDKDTYLRQLNQMLLDHNIIPGTLAGDPVLNNETWDFSAFDAELDRLPEGAYFFAPMPYNTVLKQFIFTDPNGEFYTRAEFEDLEFVRRLENYLTQLANYLKSKGRLAGALAYPTDQTRWVADEPDHNGADGYARLGKWKAVINRAGLRVIASRVSPAPYAPDWLPSEQIADNTHVHIDLFDVGPQVYTTWMASGKTSSVYLNHYGDMVELPASIHRSMVWRMYGYGISLIAGYEATDWFDEKFNLLDPFTQADMIAPKFGGYGVGALVYPNNLPSLRIKVLREAVEDARLLDLYGFTFGADQARAFALCLSPIAMTDQNPPADIWDKAHTALLQAITTNTPVDQSLCQPLPTFAEQQLVADMEAQGEWGIENTDFQIVPSPFGTGNAFQLTYQKSSAVSLWLGGRNWANFDTVLIDVQNPTPYYVEFDFAIGDDNGGYILLRPGTTNIAPNSTATIWFPLVIPFTDPNPFNFGNVTYLELYANTQIERTNGFEEEMVYDIGARTVIIDNIRLAKKQ